MFRRSVWACAVWALCALGHGAAAQGTPGVPMVDTHNHFQAGKDRNFVAGLKAALREMDRVGIARMLLMPPPLPQEQGPMYHDIEDLQFALKDAPGRVALLVGSSLNVMIHSVAPQDVTEAVKARFAARVKAILDQGAVGLGEIAIHHVSIPAMGSQHAYEFVPADHPLMLLMADLAAERGVPIDLHMDLVPEDMPLPAALRPNPLNPDTLPANAEAFKRLLRHNPKTRFVWSHVGFEPLLTRQPQRVREWLKAFPNLYMSFRLNRGHAHPAAALGPDGQLKPAWMALVTEFADRFLLGSDSFYDRDGVARGGLEPGSNQGLRALRNFIDALPLPVAQAVAHGNAIRLYQLPPLTVP
ncbi:amidohydrolase family protein [Aquabacterium sp. A08]|uniref:amidohydrolase family protein n=1 Tax=Aquabacterium sp. A08 TaxID=2718532 RepID=UPI00141E05B1|nr:amidohydrolase family protein [Aquabacterium sp. A08]NIC42388.1 amidohydrolase family protein [Aquabacterium sp. A08]